MGNIRVSDVEGPSWWYWIAWVVISTSAILRGFAMLYALIFAADALFSGVNEDRVFGRAMYPLLGILLGTFQWILLRAWAPRSGWWIAATAGGLIAGLAAGLGLVSGPFRALDIQVDYDQMSPILFAIVGIVLGLAQLPVIRRYLRAPALWVLASGLGWAALGVVIRKSIDRPTDMVALGAVPAAFTGLALIGLWRGPEAPLREQGQVA
jgi:hypothetical protein